MQVGQSRLKRHHANAEFGNSQLRGFRLPCVYLEYRSTLECWYTLAFVSEDVGGVPTCGVRISITDYVSRSLRAYVNGVSMPSGSEALTLSFTMSQALWKRLLNMFLVCKCYLLLAPPWDLLQRRYLNFKIAER